MRSRDGLPLCVFETGDRHGPTLVLIHGFSQSHVVFKLQYASDLPRDYRLLAYDLRGHGCSGKPWRNSDYRSARVAADLASVLRQRQVRKPVLIGWSYGGYVIMDYVRHYGTRELTGAVLVGSNAGLAPAPTDPGQIERAEKARAASRNASPDITANILAGRNFVKLMTAKPAPADVAEIMFAAHQMLPIYARRAMSELALQNDDLIGKLDLPVLLLVGDQDFSQSPAALSDIASQLPHGKLQVMAGSGHAPFIDAPAEFDAAIRQFAQSVLTR
jgi:pimeloyl-ACP methyl ester carboxylesterase